MGKQYAMNHIMTFIAIMSTCCDMNRHRTKQSEEIVYGPTIFPGDGVIVTMERKGLQRDQARHPHQRLSCDSFARVTFAFINVFDTAAAKVCFDCQQPHRRHLFACYSTHAAGLRRASDQLPMRPASDSSWITVYLLRPHLF
jgi:hypothetical protein